LTYYVFTKYREDAYTSMPNSSYSIFPHASALSFYSLFPSDTRIDFISVRDKCKEWFGYTIPSFQPLYTYIPLVSPLKKNDNMDGFNLGEDNQIKYIDIKNGKLRIEVRLGARGGRVYRGAYVFVLIILKKIIWLFSAYSSAPS
jgi:hypothetical protein